MKTVIKYCTLALLGVLLFKFGSEIATQERGYAAVGGEVFALFLPLFYYIISSMIKDFRMSRAELEANEHDTN